MVKIDDGLCQQCYRLGYIREYRLSNLQPFSHIGQNSRQLSIQIFPLYPPTQPRISTNDSNRVKQFKRKSVCLPRPTVIETHLDDSLSHLCLTTGETWGDTSEETTWVKLPCPDIGQRSMAAQPMARSEKEERRLQKLWPVCRGHFWEHYILLIASNTQ